MRSLAVSVLTLLLALRLVAGQTCPADGELSFHAHQSHTGPESGVCDANFQPGTEEAASFHWDGDGDQEVEEVERDKRDAASKMRKKSDSPVHLAASEEAAPHAREDATPDDNSRSRGCEDDGNLDKSSCEDRAAWMYSKAQSEDDEFQVRPLGVVVSDDVESWSRTGPSPDSEDGGEMILRARRMSPGDNAASLSWTVVPAEADEEDEPSAERHRRQNNYRRPPVRRGFYRGQVELDPAPTTVTPAPATGRPRMRAWPPKRNFQTRAGIMLPPYNSQDFQQRAAPQPTTTTTTPAPPLQRGRRLPLNEAELWRAWRKIAGQNPKAQQVPVNNTDLWNAWLKYSADRGAGGNRRYRRPEQEEQTTTTTTTPAPPALARSRMLRYTHPRVSAMAQLSAQLQSLSTAAAELSRQLRLLAEATGSGGGN